MPDLRLSIPAYPLGAPCWVDLLVTDVAAAQHFYTELFGWDWRAGDSQSAGYTLALLDGYPMAGISRRPAKAPVDSMWTTYLRAEDLEATGRAILAHGGRPIGRPIELRSLARSFIAVDPDGTYFGVWEPGLLPGCGVLDQPSTLTWNELTTRQYDRVQQFLSDVFEVDFVDETEEGGPRWSTARTNDGNPAYGLAEISPEWPADIPSHWVASFATHNIIESVARALTLGATLLQGPFDGPYGLGAVLRGPQGEVFSLLVPELE
jgi:predicted enzyme related to lactoylglutathione lyase